MVVTTKVGPTGKTYNEAPCDGCGILVVWSDGSKFGPVDGKCAGCRAEFAQKIGWSLDAMVSGPALDAKVARLAAILAGGDVSHSRSKYGSLHVYRRDRTSPTGVSLAASFPDCPEIAALLRGSLSPLSPTEPR